MARQLSGVIFVAIFLGIGAVGYAQNAETSISFDTHIRPILSNHCYACHGQDEATRESGLRLDVREEAIDYGAIVPGDLAASSLVERIETEDLELRMPPSGSGKELSAAQIELLKNWIEADALYQLHWAFRVVQPVEPPRTDGWTADARNRLEATGIQPIDLFISQRLNAVGLTLSEQADRATLIRRLYQDLLGLLPSVEEVLAFEEDGAPDAYGRLVDRVLENQHYGERWGRHWLDQARYADSNGYSIDGDRVMWPYRDWVIHALNSDMPFDQFTIEQLAGDLLPNATKSQLVATAFHRNTMINQEGGVKADEFRHEAVLDRVNTTGAVWLGLTLGCAQCHTHKFDPITHDDYFRFYAYFNSAADANSTGKTVAVGQGEMFGWSEQQQAWALELPTLQRELTQLKDESGKSSVWAPEEWDWDAVELKSQRIVDGSELQLLDDGSLFAPEGLPGNATYQLSFSSHSDLLTAIRLSVLPDERLPANGPGRAGNGNFVLSDLELLVDGQPVRFAQAWADHSQTGYSVADAIDGDTESGWAINVNDAQTAEGQRMNARHEAIFSLAEPLRVAGKSLTLVMKHDRNVGYQIGRFSVEASDSQPEILTSSLVRDKRRIELQQRVAQLRSKLPAKGATAAQMVMEDLDSPPPTYRLDRGDFLSPAVEEGALLAGIPQILQELRTTEMLSQAATRTSEAAPGKELAGLPAEGCRDALVDAPESVGDVVGPSRLDLARWIVSPSNPLTTRVTVNRVWSRYFGRGLVETENDFGMQGTPPSHPELLDWLAYEFMRHQWSMKWLHREIVMSATYRQSSSIPERSKQVDPQNFLLSHQARVRVEAEIVRDQALSAGNRLTSQIGGPSVFPPQPDGIFDFTQQKKGWPTSQGEQRFRRTLYTTFYRSAPYPLLTTFDSPDFSTTCTARARSNTPLQSLAVANDPMFIEISQALAEAVLNKAGSEVEERLGNMFRRCLARSPTSAEQEVLLAFYQRQLKSFEQSEQASQDFVHAALAGASHAELAAWTAVARVLINTDEFVTRN
ncbi:PSD1 and planctomycete cytochrome C domain-containing protein [Aureliella helgolandensis]|uniref:Planctomycete cytochrome C n=1 Tax=Aureliella helgolandensis TaxID=2527968 RepID=A0A518GGJ0_9BACT|nr:PSD1 and planctomycete cytochrome C domain-containing protein [Aureliella helgolandensis]QDV27668.1 Planctomycete cytochrome C [Aureliella helgolandensis]